MMGHHVALRYLCCGPMYRMSCCLLALRFARMFQLFQGVQENRVASHHPTLRVVPMFQRLAFVFDTLIRIDVLGFARRSNGTTEPPGDLRSGRLTATRLPPQQDRLAAYRRGQVTATSSRWRRR